MLSLFQSFCEMLDDLPAAAVKKAVAVERHMLEEDIAAGREQFVGEAASVLTFCKFLESVDEDRPAIFPNLPLEHLPRYTRIIHKLVEAGELSLAGEERFNGEFERVWSQMAD